MSRAKLFALVALFALASAAQGQQCVIGPDEMGRALSAVPDKATVPLGNGEWQGDVYVLPYTFGDSYDVEVAGAANIAPRQWVARSFFGENPDGFDFLVVFTNFDWDAGGDTRGLYWSIANDVEGIGVPVFDLSDEFDSVALQGYIDAKSFADYRLTDGALDTRRVEEILNHEIGHRWLAHPTFDGGGSPGSALLGRDGSHWSYLLDSQASFMYGSEWTANGDGTFTATAVRQRYSDLDLYLMGFLPPSDVAPFTLLVNPEVDARQIPLLGATVAATAETVTVDQIVAAEGPRVPDHDEARHEFRLGIVYLVDPSVPFVTSDVQALEGLRDFWQGSFFRHARGRGVIEVEPLGEPAPNPGREVDLEAAIAWLAGRTGAFGLWQDSSTTVLRDSAEVLEALSRAGGQADLVDEGLVGLPNLAAGAAELRYRQLETLARFGSAGAGAADAAAAERGEDGGWPAFPRYQSDPATTARAVRALTAAGRRPVAEAGWSWLQGQQNPDGGWGWQPGSPSSVAVTHEVLLAARRLAPADFWSFPAVTAGVAWLSGKQLDGGFGDVFPNVAQTALFLQLTLDQPINQGTVQQALEFLADHQRVDGSWESSVYKTAVAVNALVAFFLPDPFVEPSELFVTPARPFDDEDLALAVAVRNGGTVLAPGTEYRWEVSRADDPATPVLAIPGILPALGELSFVAVNDTLAAGALPAGDYVLAFVVDPEGEISEKDRDNNSTSIALEIRGHPEGVDLFFNPGDVVAVPEEVSSMPQATSVQGVIRNAGQTAAAGVAIEVYDGDPAGGRLLGVTTVDVPALGAAPFSVPVSLDEARTWVLTAVADPADLLADADRFNNRASLELRLRLATDVEIEPGSLTATPASVEVGESLVLSAVVHNGGTVPVADVPIAFTYEAGASTFPIRLLNVAGPIEPDGVELVEVDWEPNLAGDLTVTVEVDPQDVLGDVEPGDNRESLVVTVGGSALANLRVTPESLTLAPVPTLQGRSAAITARVENPTANGAGAFVVELWLDEVGGGLLLTSETVPDLAAGAFVDVEAVWDVAEPDDRLVWVVVDPADGIVEFNEDDNRAFVVVDVHTLPDLAVTSGGVEYSPAFPRLGDALHFDVLVANQGDQTSPATRLELVDGTGTVLDSEAVPAMPGHTELSFGLDWTPPPVAGDFPLAVSVNAGGAFPELVTSNNRASFSVAVQDADLFVSNQIFSPNGDGIQDTATFFFRVAADEVRISDDDGRLVRVLEPDPGAESAVWDGRGDGGELARDGLYLVEVGELETWVVLDNNLYAVTSELDQLLLVGFIEPHLPGFAEERSFFTSAAGNPLVEEVYLVERFERTGLPDEDKLQRWSGDELIELGDYPASGPLISATTSGDTFLAGFRGSSTFELLRYPGPAVDTISRPQSGLEPWLSPDGRWLVWASTFREQVTVQEVDDPAASYTFFPDGLPGHSACGYSVVWSSGTEVLVAVDTRSGFGYLYQIDLAAEPPSSRVFTAEGAASGCTFFGEDATSGPPKLGGRGPGDPRTAADFERRELTWVVTSSGYYGFPEIGGEGQGEDDFRVVWGAEKGVGGGRGSVSLEVSRLDLGDGAELESVSVDLETSPFERLDTSLSSDGFVVAYNRGYFEIPRLGAGEVTRGRVLPMSPEPATVTEKDEHEHQFLVRWDRGERRELPLILEEALWTPSDKYLVASLGAAFRTDGLVPYFTPAANLTVRIRPRVLFGDTGVDLWVLATDRYLDSYVIEYRDLADASSAFAALGLPSDEPLYGERWGTWLPPGNGRYRLRLTARDRAGNVRTATRTVVWNGDNDIANLYLEKRHVSPRSSPGVQDELVFHYTVLRPANLGFAIADAEGNEVAEIPVAADLVGPRTTTWDGTDAAGNPVPDGRYLLTLGAASWPFVVDNTPPQVVLAIEDTKLVQEVPDSQGFFDKDLLVNELFAAVRDENLAEWTYEAREAAGPGEWRTLAMDTVPFESDGERAWRLYGAGQLAGLELRLAGRDLAGNLTVTSRSHRDERLVFTDSEPGCRSTTNPCVFPDRPELGQLSDGGGFLVGSDQVLQPFYDTLLVQSTVWTDELRPTLEYREVSLIGLPTGPWLEGVVQVGEERRLRRRFCTRGVSLAGEQQCVLADDFLLPLYWDHPDLPLVPYEVRLRAPGAGGQEVVSEPVLFQPEVPLITEYLGIDAEGDHFRITNASSGVVLGVDLAIRLTGGGEIRWEPLLDVVGRLRPGEFVELATGCTLVIHGGRLARAQGTGGLGEEAVSLPVPIPSREGKSALRGVFRRGSCASGPGNGFFGIQHADPCVPHREKWPPFWVSRGDPSAVVGRVAEDPTGVDFELYELLVDGVPVLRVEGPLTSSDYQQVLDLSSIGEGGHTLSERYSYGDEPGLLGSCPQSLPLRIDRTPPAVAIADPPEGATVCPADLTLDVRLDVDDAGPANHQVRVSNLFTGDERCAPYSGPGGTFSVAANRLDTGVQEIRAEVMDQAGNATCTSIPIVVPDLPDILLGTSPPVFSPVPTLDRPDVEEISFTTGTPGTFEVRVTDLTGADVQLFPGGATDGVEVLAFAWDGTDLAGGRSADGRYNAVVRAVSPCGAEQTVRSTFELDATPPRVVLTAPVAGRRAGASVEFIGLATDLHFEAYHLQVLSLDDPDGEWRNVVTETRQTGENPATLGVWRTEGFPAGAYLVRLHAQDRAGNEAVTADVPVTIRERRLIQRFERRPEIFSPNADGVLDEVTMEYLLVQEALVTLRVLDAGGLVAATLASRMQEPGGVPIERTWAGQLDAGGLAPDGEYELVILAEDPVDPPELEPEEERLTVNADTLAPAIEVVNPVALALSGLPIQVRGSLDELHPDTWQLDLRGPEGDREPLVDGTGVFDSRLLFVLAGRADGVYQLIQDAVDLAGNSAQLTREFTIDDTAPAVEIHAPEGGSTLNTTADRLGLDGEVVEENLESFEWSYAPGTAPADGDFVALDRRTSTLAGGQAHFDWDASGLDDGPYTLRLAATDELGRTAEARLTFTVDNTPPEVALGPPADGSVVSDSIDVAGSVDDANLTRWDLRLRPAGGPPFLPPLAQGTSPAAGVLTTWNVLPADGAYELVLDAGDAAGNTASATVAVTVSVTPLLPPVLVSAGLVSQQDVALAWQPADGPPPAAYNVYRDGVRINAGPVAGTAYTDTGLAEGTYVYTVRAVSAGGLESADSNAREVRVSLSGPVASISRPVDGSRVSGEVQVVGTAFRQSGLAGWNVWVRPAAGPRVLVGSGTAPVVSDFLALWDTALPQWPDGAYEVILEVDDLFGNRAAAQVAVEVDNTPPAAPVLTFAAALALDADAEVNDVHVEWSLDPAPADLAGYYLYRNGQLANAPGPVVGTQTPFLIGAETYDDRDLPDGTYVYFVTSADTAENESAASNSSDPIVIDTRRPHAVIVDPPDGSEFEDAVLLEAETPDLDVVSLVFEVLPDGETVWTPLGPALDRPPWVLEFAPGSPGLYHLRAVAADAQGADPAPESISLTETDLAPPGPADLTLRVDGGDVHLSWTRVPDPTGDLVGFLVWRDGDLLTPTPLAEDVLAYVDGGLADGFYDYRVTAVDAAGNEGAASPVREARIVTGLFDWIYPITEPATVILEGRLDAYDETVELQRRGAGGELERLAVFSAGFRDFVFPPVALEPGWNVLSFVGSDAAGNRSRRSRELALLRHDRPARPTGLAAAVAGDEVTLDWRDPADPDGDGFRVFREGTLLNESEPPFPYEAGHQVTASGGDPDAGLLAVDGDPGTGWAPDAATVQAGAAWEWTWPEAVTAEAIELTWSSTVSRRFSVFLRVDGHWLWWDERPFNFSTSVFVDGGPRIDGVRVELSTNVFDCLGCALNEVTLTRLDREPSPPWVDPGLAAGVYTYEVVAANRFDQRSEPAFVQAVVGLETPGPPAAVSAAASGCGEITVEWQAPAVLPAAPLGYRLYRGLDPSTLELLLDLPADAFSYVDADLALGETYFYAVATLAEVAGTGVESAAAGPVSALAACDAPPPPELTEPTVAGVPVLWPSLTADVGGRAFPGSLVTLLHDGSPVASRILPGTGADRRIALPGFESFDTLYLSADERFATYVDDDTESVALLDLTTGALETFGGEFPFHPALSRDGERLVYADETPFGSDLFLLERSAGTVRRLTDDPGFRWAPVFTPDGRFVLYLAETPPSFDSELRRLDLASGRSRVLYTEEESFLEFVAVSGDGRWVAMETFEGPRILDLATGELQSPLTDFDRMTLSATPFSPDHRRLVWTRPTWDAQEAEVWVYDLETGTLDPASPAPGEFGAVFLDERTLAVLQTGAAPESLRLVARSLVDGRETVISEGLSRFALPSSDGAPWNLFTTAPGVLWVTQDRGVVRFERPSGSFVFPRVALHPGVNTFEAVQEIEDDLQTSEPIEVEVEPSAFGDARVLAFAALPAFPLSGDGVVVDGIAHNAGEGALEGLVASLSRVAPNGAAETVLVETFDLAPGGTRRVRAGWTADGPAGDWRWRLRLDPAGLVPELDETNNDAEIVVPVRLELGVDAAVRTDRETYFLDDVVAIAGEVTANDAPRDTAVTISVETAGGEPVETVETRVLPGFGAASADLATAWTASGVFPGDYRVRLVAEREGAVVAEAVSEPFVLSARLAAEARTSADRPTYRRGQTANLVARVSNAGDDTLRDLAVTLRVDAMPAAGGPSGPPTATTERAIPALSVDALRSLNWAWNTRAATPGTYNFSAVVADGRGNELARSAPVAFVVTGAGADLSGVLAAAPAFLEPHGPVGLAATVRNDGDLAVTDALFTLDVVDPETGDAHGHYEQTASVGVGGLVELAWTHLPATELLRSFVAVLGAGQEQLATASFTLVDLTPPDLVLLEPAGELACRADAPLRAEAVDALTSVFRVFFRLDGRARELPLVRESVESDVYTTLIRLDPERASPYRLEVLAEDVVGNVTAPLAFDYAPEIDLEPPELAVDGPPEGACVASAVFTFSAEDANLESLTATVDGLPYQSGQPLAGDGERALLVVAADACGRTVEESRTVLLDTLPPEVAVTGAADGEAYFEPVTLEWTVSDANLTSATARLDGADVVAPVTVSEPGIHQLVVTGEDCAARRTETIVTFEIIEGNAPPLEIPALGPWGLALLSLLLALAAGRSFRRQENHPVHRNPTALILAVLALGAAPAARADDACDGHFPLLSRLVDTGSPPVVLKSHESAVERELAVEEALWRDEIDRQRDVLERARIPHEAAARLDEIEAAVLGDIELLAGASASGKSFSAKDLAKVLGCAGRSGSPISARLRPGLPEARKRELPAIEGFPDDYLAPPSEELRDAVKAAVRPAVKVTVPDPVADKVEELGSDPVALYTFVLNEIRPAHYFGRMQGPAAVLASGAANDADQAELLATLLRQAGLPARLAWGVVEMPAGVAFDHFGAGDSAALERVLTEAGIPWEPVLAGGRPRAYRLERVWAEVFLPYANFRGVVLDDSGATWLALDPQAKTFAGPPRSPGALDGAGVDGRAFVDAYLAGGSCGSPLEAPGACPLPSALLTAQLGPHLAGGGESYPAASAARPLAPQSEEVLPAGMVGRVHAVRGFGLELPETWRHRLRLRARDGQTTLLDVTVGAADLAGREALLWFVPATPADEALTAAYGGNLWLVPPYLVNARLQLRSGDEVLATGSTGLGMGLPFELEVTVTAPSGDSLSFVNDHTAGVPVAFGVAAGAHGYRPPFGEPSNTPEALTLLAAEYLDAVADLGRRLARLDGLALVHPFPSVVTVGSVMEARGSFGLVERLDWQGIFVDADLFGQRAVGSASQARRWRELVELEASARERQIFEARGMAAMSADLALVLARERGVAVLRIDAANQAAVLPGLPHPPEVLAEIQGWVLSGGEALVPAEPLDFVEWTGVGYLLRDPATGEARYQLSGSLSGGMIAVPPFEVVEGLREPLRFPRTGRTNTDGDDAVAIEIFDGNLQIAVVGEILSDGGEDTIALKVVVTDDQDTPVKGAAVTFEVITGGGNFGGASSITVESTWGGLATAELTLGTRTDVAPYYLKFPDEEWSQRVGLNLVRAEVNGYGLTDLFYEFGMPDEVAELQTPNGASLFGLPHLSIGRALRAVPADQYGNPIANEEVTFNLQGGASGEPGKGPELLSREAKQACRPGPVVAGECGATGEVTASGSISGVWTWLVAGEDGPYSVVARAMDEEGAEVSTTFTATVRTELVPAGAFTGLPLLLVSGRGQPRDDDTNESIEAYVPGAPSVPLQVSVHVFREDFHVEACGDDRYCRVGDGTYTTSRLGEEPAAACMPDTCPGGTVDERVEVNFNGPGASATVSSTDEDGLYRFTPTLPDGPGRHVYTVTPTAFVAVPKEPDDPERINEVVPCGGDPPCGAEMEIREVSDPNWRAEYVLWTLEGRVVEPTPVVKLGHRNRHETETDFPYVVEPAGYPALNTYVYFLEDGFVNLFAQAEGGGPGAATLPVGEIFARPEGRHEAAVAVNVGWVWTPRADERVSLTVVSETVPFPVVMFDVDVDSDNDNGVQPPERNDAEERIEEDGGPDGHGKLVFVNHDNDDAENDSLPDYADPVVAGEDNLVPMVVELRPEQGDWESASLTFHYTGTADDDELPDGSGEPLGNKGPYSYFDYSGKKTGVLRLWRIDTPEDARPADAYLKPGEPFAAGDLGFGPGQEQLTFWIEGMNGAGARDVLTPEDVKVELSFNGTSVEEVVRLTPLEPGLGLNNSNGQRPFMRVGVPDGTLWTVDENDEMVEDQGDGFRFWLSDVQPVSMDNITDLVPLTVEVPQVLLDREYEFALTMVDPAREVFLEVYPVPRGNAVTLSYLKSPVAAELLLDDELEFHNHLTVNYASEWEIPVEETESALLFRIKPQRFAAGAVRQSAIELLYREPGDFRWQSVDSTRLTVESIDGFYSMWSSRELNGGFFQYPTEFQPNSGCGMICETGFQTYGTARHVTGTGMPDRDKVQYFVFVHGYNVNFEEAKDAAREVTRRMYWTGFRGNLLTFTWDGAQTQVGGFSLFSPNVDNAFRTGPRFGEFLRDQVLGTFSARPENVNVMAHSLGNQVVLDAMRLHRIQHSGLLFNKLISAEPAVWTETFWEEEEVRYLFPLPTTYTVEDLRTNSWAFWFNQADHPAHEAVNAIVHSWAPLDFALVSMRLDDYLIRNPRGHAIRGSAEPDEFRIPVAVEFFDQDDLSNSIGTMLKVPFRSLGYSVSDLYLPAGTMDNPTARRNIDATTYDWGRFSHSAFQGSPYPEIWLWYANAVGDEIRLDEE